MAPSKPAASSSAATPKPSSGRPKIFGGGTRHSTRIEKKNAVENDRTRKQNQGSTEAEPEENVQPQRARPGFQSTETQSYRRSNRKALPSDRCLRSIRAPRSTTAGATNRDAFVDDGENESRQPAQYHTISEGGPRLKNTAELIVETDTWENFRIPSNNIIANEDVDTMVYQQMRRLAKDGNLTPNGVRGHLIRSVEQFEACWRKRRQSRPVFWERACACTSGTSGTWMNQLNGPDCRQFFLWLLFYFRHGSGRKGANDLIRAFERLDQLFKEEEKEKANELDELDGVQRRLRAPANRSLARSNDRTAVGRSAAPKKKGSNTMPEDGNIFRWSGDTNMTDFELSGIDVEGLTPIVDVGGRRKKREEWNRMFYEELGADRERIRQEEAGKAAGEQAAAQEAAAAPKPQLTTQGRKRSSRKRPNPPEVDNLMPEMNQQNAAKAGRKFSEFEEDEEDDDGEEEEERLRAAALKRQKLLERHAARGGPKSD
ncbi:hypothetical protein INS49_005237 [Diaporthe citri]|uniref:uncharacterized protein n=1 Tax=Diaporthe citri TaxID=83186 RepID=UPI001C822CB0|nr:uncharacterized protein INS49_005237 [Diaporthe citri]KAG6353759.1 hypothetical protein INS49_005237 [Diaporthe citri]